jgi:demethylmenaquinone methyltransferase/2-methoxy-6-polyprenyl-1,4-benzoquinol methylase
LTDTTESAEQTARVLREQADYYRARAPEYDEWWLRQGRYDRGLSAEWKAEAGEVAAALDRFAARGRVLELACGTGIWTERLARGAAELTAVDASAEMIAINAARVASPRVRYVHADLFEWRPAERFDAVFFGFWLSHVPAERFAAFWELVSRCLAPGGRVFFVDSRREQTSTAADHVLPEHGASVMRRRLNDGREFRIYKVFHEPQALALRLRGLGWTFDVRETSRYFVYGSGVRGADVDAETPGAGANAAR